MWRVLPPLGFALLLASSALAPLSAQERAGGEALVERLRQIQGEIQRGQPAAEPSRRPGELIREIEVIEQQLQSEGTGQEPLLGEEEIRSLVREGLGVEVLNTEVVERGGRQVYAVTAMNPPGDTNDAFMIRTLLVDATTGALLGRVPDMPRTALDPSPGAAATGLEGSGPEIRRRTYR